MAKRKRQSPEKNPTLKRTSEQIEEDLVFIAERYVKGATTKAISEELNAARPYSLSLQQVWKDCQKILNRWQNRHEYLIDKYLAEQLEKLNRLEYQYWNSFEKSKSINPDPVSTITGDNFPGDPEFLKGVERVIQQRIKLLGMESALKMLYAMQGEQKDGGNKQEDKTDILPDIIVKVN